MESDLSLYSYPYNYHTDGLSDFSVLYDEETKDYSFELETLIDFDDKEKGPKHHISDILKDFSDWMDENGYDKNVPVSFWEYFSPDGICKRYKSIEKVYSAFRMIATGFLEGTYE